MSDKYFLTLAHYNAWANERLYHAAGQLSVHDYMATRPAFFGSIHGALNHILVADRLWIARIEEKPAPALTLDQILYGDLVGLHVARQAEDQHIVNVIGNLDPQRLETNLRYTTTKGERQSTPLRLVLGHMFNHQTHHRGQVHGLLSQTPVAPPPLDLAYFIREAATASD